MNDWDSKHYQEHAKVQEMAALKILDRFTFRGDEVVLDIGCGDGKVTQEIARRVPNGEAVGIDVSPNMIQSAQSTYTDVLNLSFIQKGAEGFYFERTFDLITSFFALHWIPDHAAVLRNCKQALKPGGTLLFFMPLGQDERVARVFGRDPWKSKLEGRPKIFERVSLENYQVLLDNLDFTVDALEATPLVHRFKNQNELVDFFMTWLPYYTCLEDAENIHLASELVTECIGNKKSSATIKLSMAMLYVKAHIQ